MLGIHIAPLGADANGGQAIGGALAGLIQIGQNFKIDLGLGRGAKAEPKNQYCAGKNAASGAGYRIWAVWMEVKSYRLHCVVLFGNPAIRWPIWLPGPEALRPAISDSLPLSWHASRAVP